MKIEKFRLTFDKYLDAPQYMGLGALRAKEVEWSSNVSTKAEQRDRV